MTQIAVLEQPAVSYDTANARIKSGSAGIQQMYLRDRKYAFRDITVQARFGYGTAPATNDLVGVSARRIDNLNKLLAVVNSTTLFLQKIDAGNRTTITSVALPASLAGANTPYWIRLNATRKGTVSPWQTDVSVAIYTSDPDAFPAPTAWQSIGISSVFSLSTADHTKFGEVVGEGGVFMYQQTNWQNGWVDDFEVRPTVLSGTVVSSPVNFGNFRAQPIIRIGGGLTNPRLLNNANGEQIKLIGSIQSNEWIDIDIEGRKITLFSPTYPLGINRFSLLDMTSDWMEFEPGDNYLELYADSSWVSPYVNVYFRDTWM